MSYAEGEAEGGEEDESFDDEMQDEYLLAAATAAEAFDRPADGAQGDNGGEVAVKDEPEDEDDFAPPQATDRLEPMLQDEQDEGDDDEKKDFKPVLKLSYTGERFVTLRPSARG